MAGKCPDDRAAEFAADTLRLSTRELAREYGIAISTVKDWRLDARDRLGLEVGYGRRGLNFIDKKEPLPDSDERLWRLVAQMSAERELNRRVQDRLSLELVDGLPVGIAFTGDWQIGMEGVLYGSLDSDMDRLAAAEGVYVVGMGDYAHNPKVRSKPGTSLYRMVLPDPDDQYRLALYQLRKVAGKTLGLVRGCHDDFEVDGGHDILNSLVDEIGTANLGHGAVIEVLTGDQTYQLLVRHKYRGSGISGHRRAWADVAQADAVVFAHKHSNLAYAENRAGRDVVYVQSGSYFVWDEFGMKIGHFQGQPGVPLLVLYPDRHQIVQFYGAHLDEGLRFLESERAHYLK